MSGVEIEYLLGLYFLVTSVSFGESGPNKKSLVFEWVQFVFAVVLLFLAWSGWSLI